jgi:glycosyltransferase involved in cell wall biosynthesis
MRAARASCTTKAVSADPPLVSVIVPTRDRPALLAEALASVRAQSVADFECIVVDDAGEEPASLPDDARFRLVRRAEPGGPAQARNSGIEHARGRHVAFLDDDDVYLPERLALGLEALRRAPVGVCLWAQLDQPLEPVAPLALEGDVSAELFEHPVQPLLGTCMVERAALPLFTPSFRTAEDKEWWVRLCQAQRIASVPRIGLLHRRGRRQRTTNSALTQLRSRVQLLEQHADYFGAHPRAAAFQWLRNGVLARRLGEDALARRSLAASLRARPSVAAALQMAWAQPGFATASRARTSRRLGRALRKRLPAGLRDTLFPSTY